MLTFEDCVALSDLTEEEIAAIAEHEHIPEIVAVELGKYLVETDDGCMRIKKMIRDDLEHAIARGNVVRVLELKMILRHFIEHHPPHGDIVHATE